MLLALIAKSFIYTAKNTQRYQLNKNLSAIEWKRLYKSACITKKNEIRWASSYRAVFKGKYVHEPMM
jgi:hypothetical protein